jgi:peptidoglycan/LPS O-acetylase OafA/YrhL
MALAAVASVGALRRRWWAVGLFAAAYGLHQAFAVWNCGPVWAQVLPRELASHVTRIVGVPAKWPEFLTYFFAGMVFATWRDRLPHSARWAAACAGVLVAAALAKPMMQFVLPVCGVYLLFWVALHPRLRFERFGRHGDFSYGIYLYGFPIQQLLIKWVGPADVDPLMLFALSMPLSVLAGVLSWHGVEKWFVRRSGAGGGRGGTSRR